jgi:signal transduction histidine kinase
LQSRHNMQKVSEYIGIDKISLVKVLDFLPYPFLLSELREGTHHNIFVNQKFLEEIGYTCLDIPTLNEWFLRAYPIESYRNEIMLDWAARITTAKEAGEDSVTKQARIYTRMNGMKWYEVKASIRGPFNFVAFINIDQEIIKEQDLYHLNENKDRTLSILSHDLRSPLNNLYSVLQLLNHGYITEHDRDTMLKKLSGQVFKMLEFLDTTLEWSKINFSELRLSAEQINISAIVNGILEIYKGAYLEKQIAVGTALNTTLPLRCDPEIISIIFRNIFSNAIKYTPEGGSIVIKNELRNNRYTLSVANSGQPISQEKIEMILSKHYQSERGTMGEKGIGLGLKICQQLLERVDGHLEIESGNASATIFTIVL